MPFGVVVTLPVSSKVRASAKLSSCCYCGIITKELQNLNCLVSESLPKARATIELRVKTVRNEAKQITDLSVSQEWCALVRTEALCSKVSAAVRFLRLIFYIFFFISTCRVS